MQTSETLNGNESPSSKVAARPDANTELEELLKAIATGDQYAFALFYKLTVRKMLAVAQGTLRSREDAEEIVCDVYKYVWDRAKDYDRSRGQPMSWLTVMTRNRAIDRLRRRRDTVSLDDQQHETLAASLVASALGPDQLLALVQSDTAVHRALSTLPSERRFLLGLSFFQGLTHEEIATTLGMPLGTVKSRVRRALATLERALSADTLISDI